jgi:hypothetical protein
MIEAHSSEQRIGLVEEPITLPREKLVQQLASFHQVLLSSFAKLVTLQT